MSNLKIIALILIFFLLLAGCASTPSEKTIMTYNIRHGVGMDRVLDLERAARVIETANPDIIVLNEMDNGTARSFGVLQADSLGRRLKMNARFGRSIDFDGGEYGNALLSKYPIVDFQVVDLSTDTLLEGRSIFLARLDLGLDTLFIMGTHLGLIPEEQSEQITRIIHALPDDQKLLMAGDFNFTADSEAYTRITDYLEDGILKTNPETGFTYPADVPEKRIDYIFIGREVVPVDNPLIDTHEILTASDHRPQVLKFILR